MLLNKLKEAINELESADNFAKTMDSWIDDHLDLHENKKWEWSKLKSIITENFFKRRSHRGKSPSMMF